MKNRISIILYTAILTLFFSDLLVQVANTWTQKNDIGFTLPNGPSIRSHAVGLNFE